jgi:hypothetical protein
MFFIALPRAVFSVDMNSRQPEKSPLFVELRSSAQLASVNPSFFLSLVVVPVYCVAESSLSL